MVAILIGGCAERTIAVRDTAVAPVRNAPSPEHFHVLMINGGSTPPQNYQSHLLHVRHLVDVLLAAGVPRGQITIFSADGPDPQPDVAVRETQPEPGFWLLAGTPLEYVLRTPITYVDSSVPGMELKPATRAELGKWLDDAGRRLGPGDVLLVYVTDHGNRNHDDVSNNSIQLWGKDETVSVRELGAMLAELDPKVKVVAVMSQCFSGAFASLMDLHTRDGQPSGAVCGYFASTADRPAYGCYPENRGRENVGHSFHFIDALAVSGEAPAAQAQVLVRDGSPDVPLRTSDVYLERLLRQAAEQKQQDYTAFVDGLLKEAWRDKARWEPEIRLLDRIGHAYGSFSPRSLAEVDEQANRLPQIGTELRTWSTAWHAAFGDNSRANLDRFLTAHPEWASRLSSTQLKDLDQARVRALTAELLGDLEPFTSADSETQVRLQLLDEKDKEAAAAAYRMEVRLGVLLRMRAILVDVAGRVYLATQGTPAERAAYDALIDCESLTLPSRPRTETMLAEADPYPPFDEDAAAARASLPSWMGIRFRETGTKPSDQAGNDGAAAVLTVYPDSPAQTAGLEVGDVILGPPGAPFTERNQVRTWTMLSKVDEPRQLDVVRDGQHRLITLVPKPFPMKWPELPGPPKIATPAPPLKLSAYRGDLPATLADGQPHLLFFWATWCLPCKASLPEVLAFERERKTPVIAITDEQPEQLDTFFRQFGQPFPQTVAVDEYRRNFLAYGVSGTPTFVLVDGDGTVRSYSTGYAPSRGIGVDGWKWAG